MLTVTCIIVYAIFAPIHLGKYSKYSTLAPLKCNYGYKSTLSLPFDLTHTKYNKHIHTYVCIYKLLVDYRT